MGTDMIQSAEWGVIQHQATVLAGSGIIPKAYQSKPDDIIAASLLGREVGWSPMTSLLYIHVIDGKAGMSAEGMVSLVRSKGHSIDVVQLDDNGAVVEGTRADTGNTMRYEFTREHARQAGLLNKQVWQKYFRSMAWARVTSQLCRSLWPDVIMGLSYTPEELSSIAGIEPTTPPPVVVAVEPAAELPAIEAPAPAADEAIEGTAVEEHEVPGDWPASEAQRAELLATIGSLEDDAKAELKVKMREAGIVWATLNTEQVEQIQQWMHLAELDTPDDAAAAAAAAQEPGAPIRRRRTTAA